MTTRSLLVLVSSFGFFLCRGQNEILIWSDEFEGSGAPNADVWNYDLGKTGWGNNEVQSYTSSELNARQENGKLIIDAVKNNGEWTSARMLTQSKFSFTYGRIVFRAKLPEGSGTWPALWMLGENITSVGWPACGEIDVMEHVGKNPGVVQSALHSPASFGDTQNRKLITIPTYHSEFHDYEAEWANEKIDFKVDNQVYYTFNPSVRNGSTWPFEKPFFIIMNIAMGGNFGSDPKFESGGLKNGIDPALTYARMEIDYVRVYQRQITTGALETSSRLFSVSPNPFNSAVTIATTHPRKAELLIQNLQGVELVSMILMHESTVIDCSDLSDGFYFVSVIVDDSKHTEKILLQRKM